MTELSLNEPVRQFSDWLLSEARMIPETDSIDQAIIDRLIEAGIPLVRFSTGVPSIHPQVDSFSVLWEKDKGITYRQFRETGLPSNVRNSPIFFAYREGIPRRYFLEGKPDPDEYELLTEMRDAGLTDYYVLPLPFSDGSNKAMTFATDQAGGFSDDQLQLLERLQHPLAALVETGYLKHQSITLMETYVGPSAGRRVLKGEIKRGTGEVIPAVIWFCDLKGFTTLSEKQPGPVLIDTLNAYFDATTSAIEAGGGEILKFIGDAVLAIFHPPDGDRSAAAEAALSSALQAVETLRETNSQRTETGQPTIDCGIALHVGDVIYGNVGGSNRLDFTVIGPAVNLASRIESLTRDLARPLLVSSDFAALLPARFEKLGVYELKGVDQPQSVLAPL